MQTGGMNNAVPASLQVLSPERKGLPFETSDGDYAFISILYDRN